MQVLFLRFCALPLCICILLFVSARERSARAYLTNRVSQHRHPAVCGRYSLLPSITCGSKEVLRSQKDGTEESKDNDDDYMVNPKSREELQQELNSLVNPATGSDMFSGSQKGEKELYRVPIPAFTAIAILLGSLYVMGYGIYIGLNGFPDGEAGSDLPRIL